MIRFHVNISASLAINFTGSQRISLA